MSSAQPWTRIAGLEAAGFQFESHLELAAAPLLLDRLTQAEPHARACKNCDIFGIDVAKDVAIFFENLQRVSLLRNAPQQLLAEIDTVANEGRGVLCSR